MKNSIQEMKFKHVRKMSYPCEVYDKGIRKVVTYRIYIPNTGVGMGEGPDEVLLVLSDGTVYQWGSWTEVDKPRRLTKKKTQVAGPTF